MGPSRFSLFSYRAVTDAVSRLLYFGTLIFAARRLSADAFGLLALAATVGWMAGVVSDFGLQVHVAREVAVAPTRAGQVAWPLLRFRAAAAVVAAVFGSAVVIAVLGRVEVGPVVALVAAHVLVAVAEFLYHVQRGLDRSDLESTLAVGHRSLATGASLVVLWLWPSLATYAMAALGSALLLLAATLAATRRVVERRSRSVTPVSRSAFAPVRTEDLAGRMVAPSAPASAGATLRAVWPIGLGVVLSALYFRVDLLMVARWGGAASAAHYGAVFRLVDASRLLPAAALAVAFPVLCSAKTLEPLRQVVLALAAAGLVLAGVTAAAAEPLVVLTFGEPYRVAIPLLRVLCVALPMFFVNYALTHQLIAWHRQRHYAVVCGLALGVNLAANLALIPQYGALGAAWTTVMTEIVVTLGCLVSLRVGAVAMRDHSAWQEAS